MATFNLRQRTKEEQARRLAERSIQSGRNEGKSGDELIQMWSNRLQTPGTEALANFRAEQAAKRAAQEQAAREAAIEALKRNSTFKGQQQLAFQAGSFLSSPFQTMAEKADMLGGAKKYGQSTIDSLNRKATQEKTAQQVNSLLRQAAAEAAENQVRGSDHLRRDLNISGPAGQSANNLKVSAGTAADQTRGANHLRQDLNMQVPEAQTPKSNYSFGSWLKDTLGGAAKQSAASYSSAFSNIAELTNEGREKRVARELDKAQKDLENEQRKYSRMIREMQKNPDAWTDADIANQRNRIYELQVKINAFTQVPEGQKRAEQEMHATEDALAASGAADVQRAAENAAFGTVGKVGTQALAAAAQSLADAAAGAALTAGSGGLAAMAPFALRAYGGGTQEARQNMTQADQQGQYISDVINTYADPTDPNYQNLKDYADQEAARQGWDPARGALYGLSDAAIEVFTESMWNIAGPLAAAYGGGIGGDVLRGAISKAAGKLASSKAGQKAIEGVLTYAASGATEGIEEFVGDWMRYGLNTAAIYGGDRGTAEETLANSLYEFAVGAASGLIMGAPAQIASAAGNALQNRQPTVTNEDILPAAPEIPRQPQYTDLLNEHPAAYYENFNEGVRLNQEVNRVAAANERQRTAEELRGMGQNVPTYDGQESAPDIDQFTRHQERQQYEQQQRKQLAPSLILINAMNESSQKQDGVISDETAIRIFEDDDTLSALDEAIGGGLDELLAQDPIQAIKYAVAEAAWAQTTRSNEARTTALQDAALEVSDQSNRQGTGQRSPLALPAPGQATQANTLQAAAAQSPATQGQARQQAQMRPSPLQAAAAEVTQKRTQQPQQIKVRPEVTNLTAAVDVQTARKLGTTLGRQGSIAFASSYNQDLAKQMSPTEAFQTFTDVYNRAAEGKDIRSKYQQAPQHLLAAAYTSGQADAVAADREAVLGIKPGTKYGVVHDRNYRRAKLTTTQASILDKMAQVAGVRVEFVDTLHDRAGNEVDADGAYYEETNTIRISTRSKDPVLTTFSHELIHSIRVANPTAYNALADFVLKNMPETLGSALKEHATRYGTTDMDYISEENVADAFGRMMGNEAQLKEFAKKDRNALQKIVDAVKDLITKVQRLVTHHGRGRLNRQELQEYKELEDRLQEMHATFIAALQDTQQARQQSAQRQLEREAEQDRLTDEEAARPEESEQDEEAAAAEESPEDMPEEEQQALADYYTTEEGQREELSDAGVKFSIRKEPPPEKTMIGYKVFQLSHGTLYPPMVPNPEGEGTPTGIWLNADVAKLAGTTKTGRQQVQAGGKGTSTKKQKLAFRPGWHLGDLPVAKQFNRLNHETGEKELVPEDFVFALVEYAADVDYQKEANETGINAKGNFQHNLVALKHIPWNGYYKYRTNPDPETVPWAISGAMRVLRIMSDTETDAILKENGITPYERQGGPLTDEELARRGVPSKLCVSQEELEQAIRKAGNATEADKHLANMTSGSAATTKSKNEGTRFSLREPVEEKGNLIGIHNLTEKNLLQSLELGGLPAPSIAIVKAKEGHTKYGKISLVMRKESYDPRKRSRNRIYGADAWTPTIRDSVETEVINGEKNKLQSLINELSSKVAGGYYGSRTGILDSMGVEESTTMSAEEIAESLARKDQVKAAYLASKGEDIDVIYRSEKKQYHRYGNDALRKYIETIGEDALIEKFLGPGEIKEPLSEATEDDIKTVKEAMRAKYEDELSGFPGVAQAFISQLDKDLDKYSTADFINAAWDLYMSGDLETSSVDQSAMNDELGKKVKEEDAYNWLLPQVENILGSKGVRNGKSSLTNSGKRRTFKQLHYAYTPENVVKSMYDNQLSRGGGGAVGATAIQAVAAASYRSLADVRRDSGRLIKLDDEAYDKMVQAVDGKINTVLDTLRRINTDRYIDVNEAFKDAARAGSSIESIKRSLGSNGITVTDDIAREVQSVIKEAAELPTMYFEAKPEYALSWDYVAAAVVPSNSSQELFDKMKEAGLTVLQYEEGNEADRLEKLNSVPDVRFSLRSPAEESKTLIAIHNLSEENFLQSAELGGLPAPSIAIVKAKDGHTKFGSISLLIRKEAIDPEVYGNYIYGADAWTPSPGNVEVEYELSGSSEDKLRKKYYDLYRRFGEDARPLYAYGNYAAEQIKRDGGLDATIEKLSKDTRAMKLFLLDTKGTAPEPVMVTTVTRMSDDIIRRNEFLISELGKDFFLDDSKLLSEVRDALTDAYTKYGKSIGKDLKLQPRRVHMLFDAVGRYINEGPERVTTDIDKVATDTAIKNATDQKEFKKWLDGIFSGIKIKKRIYNGTTRNGNPKYLSYTPENLVAAMYKQQSRRGEGTSVLDPQGLQALTATSYDSLDEVRKDSGRLGRLSGEDYKKAIDEVTIKMSEIADRINDKNQSNPNAEEAILEAARTNRTVNDIVKTFRFYGMKISNQTAKEVQGIYKAAANLPTEYFEAKPERVISWDSVAAAVVPSNSSQRLLDKMRELGLTVLQYEVFNDEDRLNKVNSVPEVRFSRRSDAGGQDKELNRLRQQNEKLKEQVKYWQRQLKITPGRKAKWQKAMRNVARAAISAADSTLKPADITADLQQLGEYMLEHQLDDTARDMATQIATYIAEETKILKNADLIEMYGDFPTIVRKTRLNVPAEVKRNLDSQGGYPSFRKQYMGRMTLVDSGGIGIDVFYDELLQKMPGLLDSSLDNEADQLVEIADKLDALKPIYENPNRTYLREASEEIANHVIDLLTSTEGLTAPTFADRAQEEKEAAVEKIRSESAAAAEAARREADEQIARVSQKAREAEAQLKIAEADRAKIRELLEKEQQKRTEEIAAIRLATAEREAKRRARALDSEDRQRLLKIAKRLKNRKLTRVNRALLDQYIGELDTISVGITQRTLANLTALQEWYDNKLDPNHEDYDPDFIRDPTTEERLKRLSKKRIEDMDIADVRALTDVLLNIEHTLRTERRLLDQTERREVYNLGVETIRDIEESPGSKGGPLDRLIITETLSPVRQMHRITGYRDNDPLYRRTIALADGQRAALDYQMKAERPFNRFAEDKEFSRFFSGEHAAEITISGYQGAQEVKAVITPAMRTALYLHAKQPQNLRHIVRGGITVPDMKLYKKGNLAEAYARGTTIKLRASQVRAITDQMTPKEIEFAEAVHQYLNTTSKDSINDTSEALKGYSIADVEDYFPINTDTRFTQADFETVKQDGSIEGMGILKARVNASNPIYLRDADSVLEQSISMHAKYVGLAIPVRDMNKLLNVSRTGQNAEGKRDPYQGSVQQAIENKWGKHAMKYVERMMADIQGARHDQQEWARLFAKLRSNYAGAVLTLNLSVAMKQAASYPTAAAVLGWGPLVRAMGNVGKVNLQLIEKYTPLQWYRSKGYSTLELGDMTKNDRRLPPVLNWIQAVDVITTRKLWKASEYYVRANNKELKVNSDEYYRAVADIYNRVIEETQPNYTTMQRPQLLRSDDTLLGNLQMFKTQPFQNTNILYDAGANLRAKTRAVRKNADPKQADTLQAELKTARRDWNRAVTSQLGQLAVFAGMTMAWAMLRGKPEKYEDEDKGEMTLQSVLSALGQDMASGLLSGVPFGGDAWELGASMALGGDYYGMDATTVEALNDTITAFTDAEGVLEDIIQKSQAGEKIDWAKNRTKIVNTIETVSKTAGIPVENVLNLFRACYTHITKRVEGDVLGQWDFLKLTEDPTSSKGKYLDTMYRALESGDTDAYNRMASELMDMTSGLGDDSIDGAQIESAMKSRYTKKLEKDPAYTIPPEAMALANIRTRYGDGEDEDTFGPEDLDSATYQKYSTARAEYYSEAEKTITGSRSFDKMDDDTKDKLLSAAARLAKARALNEVTDGESGMDKWMYWAINGEAYGVDPGEALLFRAAYNMAEAEKDKDGKTIAGSKQENTIEQAQKWMGMNKREQEYLSSIYWTPEDEKLKKLKENDFRK